MTVFQRSIRLFRLEPRWSIINSDLETRMDLSNAVIAQLMIPVEDFDRSVSFYRDVLGIRFLFAAPPHMAFFVCGSVRLLVGVVPVGQKAQRGSVIYFKISDIHAVYASLSAKGVAFLAPPHVVNRTPKLELWLAEFTDPDRNQFALMDEVALDGA
jgi:methylmalonyl-CoA/ethylmalonyl-CoA epimerase